VLENDPPKARTIAVTTARAYAVVTVLGYRGLGIRVSGDRKRMDRHQRIEYVMDPISR
jgi:hypothetical protein